MMYRIILLLILVLTFSCKDEKKKDAEVVAKEVVEKQYKIVKSFTNDDILVLSKTNVNLNPAIDVEYIDAAYSLSRNSITDPAYLSSGSIPVTYASEYRVSVVVKKGSSNIFGLRISGLFPDRVDAIFDLENGTVVDYKKSQDFENPMAIIEQLTDGWFKCTLSAEVAADNVRIIMGVTGADKSVSSWEGITHNQGNVFFVPSSITFEEALLN